MTEVSNGPSVIFCGSREWDDRDSIKSEIDRLPQGTTVCHGDCRGADLIAGELARERGLSVVEYQAAWSKHGPAAGPIRNQQMLDESKPVMVVAFVGPGSRGTWDMISRAEKAGVKVKIIRGY